MIVFGALLGFGGIFLGIGSKDIVTQIVAFSASLIGLILLLVGIYRDSKKNPPKQIARKPAPKVLRTHLVSVDGIKQSARTGTVSGAIVGGIIAGGLGAVVGAMSNAKEHEYTVGHEYTFLVLYDDGTKKIETVRDRDKTRLEELVSKMVIDGEPMKEEKKPAITEHKMGALPEETPRKCPHCGTMNEPSMKYCNKCGHYLNR